MRGILAAWIGSHRRWETARGGASSSSSPNGPGRSASWPSCTGLRQPQTTKHLQTLARAGLVTVYPLGQRRVYALEPAPLKALADRVRELVDTAAAHRDERDVLARYRAAIEAESAVADRERWADGRTFAFERMLPATPGRRLAALGRPGPARVLVGAAVDDGHRLRPRAEGEAVAPSSSTATPTAAATAPKGASTPPRNASTSCSTSRCCDAAGAVSFIGHYDLALAAVPDGTRLRLGLRITETAVAAVPYIAGIETGWGQVLDNLATALTTGKERS